MILLMVCLKLARLNTDFYLVKLSLMMSGILPIRNNVGPLTKKKRQWFNVHNLQLGMDICIWKKLFK